MVKDRCIIFGGDSREEDTNKWLSEQHHIKVITIMPGFNDFGGIRNIIIHYKKLK